MSKLPPDPLVEAAVMLWEISTYYDNVIAIITSSKETDEETDE